MKRILFAGLLLCACSPQAPKPQAPLSPAAASPTPIQTATTLVDPTLAQLEGIAPRARITSPAHISGLAPANWYFENSFPVVITDVYGEKIGEAPATPQVNWTDPAPVKKFDATVTFTTPLEQEGWILLTQDMPGQDDKGADKPSLQVKIPVILVPSK